jgi:hypothetical protein
MNVGVDKPEFEIPIAEMWNWHGDSPYTKFTLGGRTDVDPGFSALLASTLASVFPNSNEKEIRKTIYNATKVDPSRDIQATGKLDVDAILWVPARGKEIPDQRPIGDLF